MPWTSRAWGLVGSIVKPLIDEMWLVERPFKYVENGYSYCYLSLVQDFRTDLWEFLDSQTFGSPVDSAETLFPSSSESCGVDPLTADYWDRKLGLECWPTASCMPVPFLQDLEDNAMNLWTCVCSWWLIRGLLWHYPRTHQGPRERKAPRYAAANSQVPLEGSHFLYLLFCIVICLGSFVEGVTVSPKIQNKHQEQSLVPFCSFFWHLYHGVFGVCLS